MQKRRYDVLKFALDNGCPWKIEDIAENYTESVYEWFIFEGYNNIAEELDRVME